MPVDMNATTCITGFSNVPEFVKGLVRDIRLRWACEEIGLPYRTELLDAFAERPQGYREWQPFGQVPAFDDGEQRLFESGAILLYLAEKDERLMPRDAEGRWKTTNWLIAAINSVEPPLMILAWINLMNKDAPWAEEARASAFELIDKRLSSLSGALGDSDWLCGRFTVADIMMVTVLTQLRDTDALASYPNLAAYYDRGIARPAYQAALADQMADFETAGAD